MATKAEKEAAKLERAKAGKLNAVLPMLAAIVAAGDNGTYTPESVHAPLVEAGYVEINVQYKNEAGEIATRATTKGVSFIMEQNAANEINEAAQGAPAATNGKPVFNVVATVELPGAKRRGGKGGNVYPFDNMEVGHSFFVPATADKPTPAKSLASTVSSATARYAVEVKDEAGQTIMETVTVPVYQTGPDGKRVKDAAGKLVKIGDESKTRPKTVNTREFTIREIADGAPWGFTGQKGAGIWRVK